MIDQISLKMAVAVKNRAPEHPASLAVLKHALAVLINTFSIIVLSVLVGMLTGHTKEIVIIMVSFASLRMLSGGFHLKTGDMCVIVTTSIFVGLSYVNANHLLTIIFTVVSVLLALLFAPSGIANQSRIPKKYYPLLKVASVILISLNFVVGSSVIAVCFLTQSLTLIPRKEVRD